ncbi:hypothetical protein BCR34DRAFT_314135 [Clohesyomyces aquaticus]|uniref:Uncharacterized protein n=1 Tax=Clohesyomyces aquaticus TaxID=1231657 RepID=A0A1Y1ZPP1_9PLEO|nr:hypothetical protein BCR34DRAFT_314135 [Clohesyomyces aquaticus]
MHLLLSRPPIHALPEPGCLVTTIGYQFPLFLLSIYIHQFLHLLQRSKQHSPIRHRLLCHCIVLNSSPRHRSVPEGPRHNPGTDRRVSDFWTCRAASHQRRTRLRPDAEVRREVWRILRTTRICCSGWIYCYGNDLNIGQMGMYRAYLIYCCQSIAYECILVYRYTTEHQSPKNSSQI